MEISGSANCSWSEGSDDDKKNYSNSEIYLNERTYFIGGRNGETSFISISIFDL